MATSRNQYLDVGIDNQTPVAEGIGIGPESPLPARSTSLFKFGSLI
jgi:hypothetical protein